MDGDRGLPNFHRNGIIDVNNFRPGSPNYNRRSMTELSDQVRILREELKKKDTLIAQLSCTETVTGSRLADSSKFESMISNALQGGANRHADVAALQVKVENLSTELREAQLHSEAKDIRLKDMRAELEAFKENEQRFHNLAETLRKQAEEAETQANGLLGLKGKSEFTITTLQKDNDEARDRIIELEGRLKTHLSDREELEQRVDAVEKKYHNLVSQITSILRVECHMELSDVSPESLVAKVSDLNQENAVLRGKLLTMSETLQNTELETKASRETIMRLVSEVGREQKASSQNSADIANMKQELEANERARSALSRENDLLKERLEQTQRAWNATRQELEGCEHRLNQLDAEHRLRYTSTRNAEAMIGSLKDTLASLLSDAYHTCPPQEDAIKDHIRSLMAANLEKKTVIERLEGKLRTVEGQHTSHFDRVQQGERKLQRAEADLSDMAMRLRQLESDLSSQSIIMDGLRTDKDVYLKFMDDLAGIMKMEVMNSDIGFDMRCDALISRAGQLIKLEADALADRSTHIYNLQRKLKSMKQQLESKDLHLDLLRKKITAMEEKVHGKTDLEKAKDFETLKVKKVHKELERTRSELKDSRAEIVELKAQLLECSNLKLTCLEQDKEIEKLEKTLDKLESVRTRQAKKIATMKGEIETREKVTGEQREVSENTVQNLSSELRTTKLALGDATKREKELVDFRQVISRMLGLDVSSLAVPNYEIISRLEKLVQAYHTNTYTTFAMDSTVNDMEDGFRDGYRDAGRLLIPRRLPVRVGATTRPRSVSPSRQTRDPQKY